MAAESTGIIEQTEPKANMETKETLFSIFFTRPFLC